MHLFDEAAIASGVIACASIGSAPNALIELSRKLLRYFCASAPMSRIGLRMPDVVSQWTEKMCVIAGVSLRMRSTAARSGGVSSGVSCTTTARRAISRIFLARCP